TLNANCQKFNAAYKRAKRLGRSGENDVNVLRRAQSIYWDEHKGVAFCQQDAWAILKFHPKWDAPEQVDLTGDVPGATQEDLFGHDARPRPAGKPRPAKKIKSDATASTGGSNTSTQFGEVMEQELRMKREAAEMAFEAQAEKDRTLMRLEELRFLATSTKDLDDVDAYWIKKQKRLIRNKMKNDLGAEDDEDEDDFWHWHRGPRGEYLNKNIPKDPSERKLIHIIGPSEYLEACAAISITKDFKAHFRGTQTQWSHLDDEFLDLLYQCFLDRYQYEETVDPKEARKVWVRRAMERCRGTWARVRIKREKKSGSKNKADWKNFRPEFVNVAADWDGILESWMKEEWVRRSKVGAENRKRVLGDVESAKSYVRHTGGSKSFRTHTHQWANESGKRPSNLKLFEKLCKKNRHEGDRNVDSPYDYGLNAVRLEKQTGCCVQQMKWLICCAEIGLHQGSAISPYLFTLILDELSRGIQENIPWCMIFADDIVLIAESTEGLNSRLERWREALEDNGLRVSREKTEYFRCDFGRFEVAHQEVDIRIGDWILQPKESFRYLGSMINRSGKIDEDVAHRIRTGWVKWRAASGVQCDKRIPLKLKENFYRVAIRPAMLYGSECWSITKAQANRVEVAELRMLRWTCGKTMVDMIPNGVFKAELGGDSIIDKMREGMLRWFGHVKRRPQIVPVRRVAALLVEGSRRRGRPKLRLEDRLKLDMKELLLSENMTSDRNA
nr:retrovirus-related Pol polyprotein LINE-1 [Tanacetum cinerariifolium]